MDGGIANYLSLGIPNTQSVDFDPAPVILDKNLLREIEERKQKEHIEAINK